MKKISIIGSFLLIAAIGNANEGTTGDEWTTLSGSAKYTDAFTEVFAGAGEEKVYPTLEVEIQQNNLNPLLYRLVNPYKNWTNPYACEVTYDESKDYYLEIYTVEGSDKAYLTKFETGLTLSGKGAFGVVSDIAYYGDFYPVEFMLENFPGAFGTMTDGVFTYPANYSMEGYEFPALNGWFGTYDPYGEVVAVNQSGNFRVEFPGEGNSIKIISDSSVVRTIYFDLHGNAVAKPEKGIFIKTEVLANGKTYSSKVRF